MTLQQIVIWIIVGGIAGWLADRAVKGVRLGLLGAILVGIIGGFLGGWLLGLLGINIGHFGRGSFLAYYGGDIVVAFIGAVILLLLLRALRR